MFSFFSRGKSEAQEDGDSVAAQESQEGPQKERTGEHTATKFETLMNLLKAIIGTGVYTMPYAFAQTGLLTGSLTTVLSGLVSIHCGFILLGCSNKLCRIKNKAFMTYPEVGESACLNGPDWAKPYSQVIKRFINFIIGLSYFGTVSVYIVIIAENLEQIVHHYFEVDMSIRLYIAALWIPCILICWVPNLKGFAWISVAGNIVALLGVIITFYYCFIDFPSPSSRPLHISFMAIPAVFGIGIFSMSAIGAVLPLENKIKKSSQMTETFGVLNIAILVVMLLYGSFGFVGYVRYGEDVEGSITLNLPTSELLAQAVKLFIALDIYATIGVQFFILLESVWDVNKHRFTKHPLLAEYAVRTFLITCAIGVAIAAPTIGPFVSLIGAFCFSIATLLIPSVLQLLTFYDQGYGRLNWLLWKDLTIVVCGIIALIVGTKDALGDIAKLYES